MTQLTTTDRIALKEHDARKMCARIKDAINDTADLIIQFYQQRGWQALGYSTWTECCREEFEKDHAWASRQIKKLGSSGNLGAQSVSPDCQAGHSEPTTIDVEHEDATEPDSEPSGDSGELDDAEGDDDDYDAAEAKPEAHVDFIRQEAMEIATQAPAIRKLLAELLQDIADMFRGNEDNELCVLIARIENAAETVKRS